MTFSTNVDTTKLKFLELADHETACEFPPGFNYRASMRRVEDLKPKLDTILGRSLQLDKNVQDASFFTELSILESPKNGMNIYHCVLGVRFSSFGNLFTVWSNSIVEKINEARVAKVIAETEEAGFIYIDTETLEQRYTGKNQYLAGNIENWRERFFDYL